MGGLGWETNNQQLMTPSSIKLKFSKDEFIVLVELMRFINQEYDAITDIKTVNLMLNTMFVKILYKFEKKLIPLQPKYSIKLDTEYAICLYLHLSSVDIDNLGVYERTVIASKRNQLHQGLLC